RRALLAYLISQGLSDKQAAKKVPAGMSKSRSTTSRDKTEARNRRWLITRFVEEQFEPAVLDDLREDAHHIPWTKLEADLKSLSGGILKGIWVFQSGDKAMPTSQIEWDWQMGNFARNSDWLILRLLLRSQSGIALGWGKTIANAIIAVAERIKSEKEARPHSRRKITIIPTVGTPP